MNKPLRYFYSKEIDHSAGTVCVRGDEAHHMVAVNRMSVGDECYVINGEGLRVRVAIVEATKKTVTATILQQVKTPDEQRPEILVCHAVPRKGLFGEVVEKCVEVGASAIVPVLSEHCMVKVDDPQAFVEKYERVARESLKQCHRLYDLKVHAPVTMAGLMTVIQTVKTRVVMDPYEGLLPEQFRASVSSVASVALAIGPEGGFSPQEKQLFELSGFSRIHFPGTVFRSETALVVGLGFLRYGMV